MAVIIDEVVTDVSSPTRQTTQEPASTDEAASSRQIKRDLVQLIERNRLRQLRLQAD